MPRYDFRCRACDERFEARVPYEQLPHCPACGAGDTERLLSGFAGPFTVGLRGAAAPLLAITADREERRNTGK